MNSSRGIVLSRENFGESDRYVQFFTRDWGMITLLAKAARKSQRRYVGGLDLFCHDEIFIKSTPRDRAYLNELTVLNSFSGLRDQYERMMLAGRVANWVRKLADTSVPMPSVYSLLGQTLALVEKESDPVRMELLLAIFKWKLLSIVGIRPRTSHCLECNLAADEESCFDLSAGGILCSDCSRIKPSLQRQWLTRGEIQFLQSTDSLRLTQWEQILFPEDRTENLSRLATQFAAFHTQTRLVL